MIPQVLGDATNAMADLTYYADRYLNADTPREAASMLIEMANALSAAKSWLPCWDDREEWVEETQWASLDLDDKVAADGEVAVAVEFRLRGTARIRPDSVGYTVARNPDGTSTLRRMIDVDRVGFLDEGSDAMLTLDAFQATPVSMHVIEASEVND